MADTVGTPDTIELGNFAVGEVPDPLLYAFKDYQGNVLRDITGGSVAFDIEKPDAADAAGAGTPSISSGATATVQYIWNVADFDTPGRSRAQFWLTIGSNVYASHIIEWYVFAGVKS